MPMDTSSWSRTRKSHFNWLGWLMGVAAIAMAVFFFWPVYGGKDQARTSMCLSNTKQLALANLIYASDHDGRFPQRDTWMDAILPFVRYPKNYRCPTVWVEEKDLNLYGYAFNGGLSGAVEPKQPETVP